MTLKIMIKLSNKLQPRSHLLHCTRIRIHREVTVPPLYNNKDMTGHGPVSTVD
eukprot:CAMPEP_0184675968 /NCGR_PEP_ID=MMETSP0308-20130426/88100_1 /TAXON_ID=38269 /ORGANISM="Gloeochaete witrockiana, Strain SAG 46.84" /LENGTH=52 /DNA_ID=CAMNT_0027123765 /DNA_START=432 /DNA_END=590 /DNA_ORIENTATION=-